MRLLIFISLLLLLSCRQRSTKEKKILANIDSPKSTTTSSNSTAGDKVPVLEAYLNEQLRAKFNNQWQVVNDSIAKWPKDEYDYFIAPKRKTDPYYPYIAKGDFNSDGNPDYAALVINDKKNNYQIALLLGTNNIVFWKEDIDLTAISTLPKNELTGYDDKKVKMKGDGINVEYFEKSSFVIFWNGLAFTRIWTSD